MFRSRSSLNQFENHEILNPPPMSSPPPSNPTTSDFLKSVARQRPRKHTHPSIYQTFNTTTPFPPQPSNSRVLYPVAYSGRGFIPKPGPVSAYPYPSTGSSNWDISGQQLVNSSSGHLHQTVVGGANPKVVIQSSVAADNTLKNTRDENGDDTFVIVRDRKVQVSQGTSLYAQCRSWLKNGFILEKPPQYVDRVKSLPKPLPASMVEPRNDDDMETEERTEDVEHLSAKELLQQHVKHAKKVRARLRNQRLQRIERYKDRLALLLPPVVDQQPKTDPTS